MLYVLLNPFSYTKWCQYQFAFLSLIAELGRTNGGAFLCATFGN